MLGKGRDRPDKAEAASPVACAIIKNANANENTAGLSHALRTHRPLSPVCILASFGADDAKPVLLAVFRMNNMRRGDHSCRQHLPDYSEGWSREIRIGVASARLRNSLALSTFELVPDTPDRLNQPPPMAQLLTDMSNMDVNRSFHDVLFMLTELLK